MQASDIQKWNVPKNNWLERKYERSEYDILESGQRKPTRNKKNSHFNSQLDRQAGLLKKVANSIRQLERSKN
jgi:hypothetical protein